MSLNLHHLNCIDSHTARKPNIIPNSRRRDRNKASFSRISASTPCLQQLGLLVGGFMEGLLWQFCLLALTPPLPSYSLPNPPVSLHTAVENNSIRYIFIDDLNKGNINNSTEILENRKSKNHHEVS